MSCTVSTCLRDTATTVIRSVFHGGIQSKMSRVSVGQTTKFCIRQIHGVYTLNSLSALIYATTTSLNTFVCDGWKAPLWRFCESGAVYKNVRTMVRRPGLRTYTCSACFLYWWCSMWVFRILYTHDNSHGVQVHPPRATGKNFLGIFFIEMRQNGAEFGDVHCAPPQMR